MKVVEVRVSHSTEKNGDLTYTDDYYKSLVIALNEFYERFRL